MFGNRDLGFAVVFDNSLSAARATQLLQLLYDASFLDNLRTQGLTAEFLVYNSDVHVFGFARVTFVWESTGGIHGRVDTVGLPGLWYIQVRMARASKARGVLWPLAEHAVRLQMIAAIV